MLCSGLKQLHLAVRVSGPLEVTTTAVSGNCVTQWRELKSHLCDMKSSDLKCDLWSDHGLFHNFTVGTFSVPGLYCSLVFDHLKLLFHWVSVL